jgi:hypothetical protein
MKSKHIFNLKIELKNDPSFRDLANVYIDKAFLRSIFLAGLGIIFFSLCLDSKFNSNQACVTIIVVGGLIEILNLITISYLIKRYSKLWEKIINQNKFI